MLHLLSSVLFLAILLGTGTLIVSMIREELGLARIYGAAAKGGNGDRPWSTRVRRLAARPVRVRQLPSRAVA